MEPTMHREGKICMKLRLHKAIPALLSALALSAMLPQAQANIAPRSDSAELIGKIKPRLSSQIKSSKYGIGFECLDRKMYDPAPYYDIAASLGVKHARCQTGWARTETKKGEYDFKWLDDVVDNLRARGIQPWFNVGYGNPLYMSPLKNKYAVGHVPLYYGEECLQAWKNYARALAEHFKGRVFEYEIWNEPNINTFWRDQEKDPAKYVELIELTAREIKAVDPNAKIGAALAGTTGKYLTDMFKKGAGRTLDFISIHPYRIVPERGYENMVRSIEKEIAASGAKTRVRQGEAGFPYNIPETCWVAKTTWHKGSEDIQAKWMLRHFLLDFTSGVDLSSYFMITDFSPAYALGKGAQVDTFAWGVTENGGNFRQRKVCQAMRNFLAVFDDSVKPIPSDAAISFNHPRKAAVSRIPELAAQSAIKMFERNGLPMCVYYLPEDLQLQSGALENVSLAFNVTDFKKPVLIDFMDGGVYLLKNGAKNIPIADYPLMVAEFDAVADLIEQK